MCPSAQAPGSAVLLPGLVAEDKVTQGWCHPVSREPRTQCAPPWSQGTPPGQGGTGGFLSARTSLCPTLRPQSLLTLQSGNVPAQPLQAHAASGERCHSSLISSSTSSPNPHTGVIAFTMARYCAQSVGLEHLCQAPHYPSLTQGEGDLVTHAQQLPKAHLLVRGMDPQLHHSAKQASA